MKVFAGFLSINLRLLAGEVDAAGSFLRGLPPHWQDLLDWHELGCALTIVGQYHQAKGEWSDAERLLDRARTTFHRAGFSEGIKVPLERQLWLAVQRKQPQRAEALALGVETTDPVTVYDLALAIPRARARNLVGDVSGALALLAAAVPELVRQDARLLLARARLVQAAALLHAADELGARAAFVAAEAAIESGGYAFLRQQDPLLWAALAPLVAATPLAGKGAARLPEPSVAPPARPASEPLVLRAFGDFGIELGGRRIDVWPRRKAKLLLAALALNPRGLATLDLAELLADGEVTEAAAVTVGVNVSALRRGLEPGLPKGTLSRYVPQRHDRYVLEPSLVGGCDLWTFNRLLADAKRVEASDAPRSAGLYEAALALYRGDLFADRFLLPYFATEREGFRREAVQALLWLSCHRRLLAQPAAAAEALVRAAVLAPHDEGPHLALLAFHADEHQVERVRVTYWDFRKALKAGLGLAPSEDFERAYQESLDRAARTA